MADINYEFIKNIYNNAPKKQKEEPAPPKQPKKIRWGVALLLALLVVFSTFLGFSVALVSRFMLFETVLAVLPGEKLIPTTNILIMGLDKGNTIHRSDSIMVVHLNPQKNEANVLAIPRDTIVSIPGRGLDKINHSFAYGGAELTRSTIENFLKIKIPYYISLNIGGLEKMIDEIGGVPLNVEKRMFYVDYAQNLYVDLKPGRQTLSGREALSYLRYRHDQDGDFGRILRQQKFMQSLSHQLMQGNNFARSPQLILKFLSYLDTNLNTKEVLGFTLSIKKIYEFGQINMDSLSGNPMMLDGIFYLKPSETEIQEAVNKYFRKD